MKKLLFIMFLCNIAYSQTLWKLVNLTIQPYNRTYSLYLDSAFINKLAMTGDISGADNITAISLNVTGGQITTGEATSTDGAVFFTNSNNTYTTNITAPNTTTSNKTITLPNKTGTAALEQKQIATVTSNFTANDTCYALLVSCSSANITITLPAAASHTGRVYHIKKIDATGYSVIIDGNSSETIDGNTAISFSTQWTNYTIISNGTAWYIL